MTGLVLSLVLGAQAPAELSAWKYKERLERIQTAIRAGATDAAREEARRLLGARIHYGNETVSSDGTVLSPIANGDPGASRLDALIAGLEGLEPTPTLRADRGRLRELAAREARRDPETGGSVQYPELRNTALVGRLAAAAARVRDWCSDLFKRIIRWLARLASSDGSGSNLSATRVLMIAVVAIVAAVLAVFAVLAMRSRASPAVPAQQSSSAERRKGEEPLSRTTTEWERYAQELMEERRYQEAIRAWYNAALVALYRAGLLRYRRDRTNWEYAYALAPEIPWRPLFLELTREFERTWYGRREVSAGAALAYAERLREVLAAVRGERA